MWGVASGFGESFQNQKGRKELKLIGASPILPPQTHVKRGFLDYQVVEKRGTMTYRF
jgi:hypothetical protein